MKKEREPKWLQGLSAGTKDGKPPPTRRLW
jgi:hypothetical protein